MTDHPCRKCGSTDRYPPSPGRTLGRCKTCRNEANANRTHKKTISPFECISDGCKNRSRAVKKAGLCNSCASRKFTGAAPKWPADPLLDYAERKKLNWGGSAVPERGGKVSLERMDTICIDIFGVHPYVVYGATYFQEVPA